MTRLRVLLARVRGLFRSRQLDRDLRDELASHIDEATQEYVDRGMTIEQARRAARLDFGSIVQAEESSLDARGRWLRDLSKDLDYAMRTLRRNPGFAAVAILSLAVGIGANSAVFSLVNALLLQPRAVSHPEQIVELYVGDRGHLYETTSYPSYVELRDRNDVLSGLAASGIRQFSLGDADRTEQVWGEAVSANYFDVLGVRIAAGRGFGSADDAAPGASPTVILSHALWRRWFSSDPGVVGRSIGINGQSLTVIGIAPPEYTGSIRGFATGLWVPVSMMPALERSQGARMLTSRGNRWLTLVGRLKPEMTIEQARARFDVLTREMQATHPEEWRARQESGNIRELLVTVLSERESRLHPSLMEAAYAGVGVVFAVVNLVLLVACVNLANMLLARAVVRRKEIAVRLSLGAGRARIIRQLVTESVVLSLIAGAVGVVFGAWLLRVILAFMPALPEGIRVAIDPRLDWSVLLFTIAFAIVTGVLFGLAPAVHSSRTDVSTILKDDSAAVTGRFRRSRMRGALVVTQVACSLLLLICAGLSLRSLERVRPTRVGFGSEDIVVAPVRLEDSGYDRRRAQQLYRDVAARIAAFPGVRSVVLADMVPGGFTGRTRRETAIEGYQPAAGEDMQVDASFVGPRYFTAMGVPIVEGRDFDERDREGAPCAAIVNEAFARRYLPSAASALGKRIAGSELETTRQCEIVGVIRDGRWQALLPSPRPFFALPAYQFDRRRMTLLVSTDGDPAPHVAAVRRALREIDPRLPLNDIQTLDEYFSASLYPFRLLGMVLGGCGVATLLLATIGIYGVVSYSVVQRTREVGIRMALGALRREILRMVVVQGMRLVAYGLAIGLLASAVLTTVVAGVLEEEDVLFGVRATDPLTFAGVTMVLTLVAVAACTIPAMRATRVDPLQALRYE
jgi:putative ABC transport system permease protein